jgi:hypothetical protein
VSARPAFLRVPAVLPGAGAGLAAAGTLGPVPPETLASYVI